MASKFINNTFALCGVEGGSITISSGSSIDCEAINNKPNVIKIGDTFKAGTNPITSINNYQNSTAPVTKTSGCDQTPTLNFFIISKAYSLSYISPIDTYLFFSLSL